MAITIRMNGLDRHSVRNAINQLKEIRVGFNDKMNDVCERLATIGAYRASAEFSRSEYVGNNDVKVYADQFVDYWEVRASGESVLFMEYGAGAKRGYGHPQPNGYGPGTYPGKGHWDDPKGWYLPKEVFGVRGIHCFGNRPTMAMYLAEQDMRAELDNVVSEVFGQ